MAGVDEPDPECHRTVIFFTTNSKTTFACCSRYLCLLLLLQSSMATPARDIDILRRAMSFLAMVAILALATLPITFGVIPSTVRVQDERTSRYFNYQAQASKNLPSYVIFDGDLSTLPTRDRPQMSSTREWHSEFNQRQQPVESQSVYSNLIQIYDNPQRKYYGPHDGKAYLEPNRVYQNYPKPLDAPKYVVMYPYESQPTQYYNEKLPERFPRPFSPNKDFEIRDPPPGEYPSRDYGFYRTQTVHYGNDDRASRKEQCNYIRLNDKGFPAGNEMCGRSISDIILAPQYSTTGDLVLEHRKRYRGVNQRKKRSADNCCGYGFHRNPDFGYNGRPYLANDNQDDYGQETSNNRGLTSHSANRGRGTSDEDDESYDDESYNNQGQSNRGQSGGRKQYQNRDDHRTQTQTSSHNRSQNNNRHYQRDEDAGYSFASNRNHGNNYGYTGMRNNEPNQNYNGFRNIGGGSFASNGGYGSYSPYGRYNK